jgi:hypothetical protein
VNPQPTEPPAYFPLYVEVHKVYRIDVDAETLSEARDIAAGDTELYELFDEKRVVDAWWDVVPQDGQWIYENADREHVDEAAVHVVAGHTPRKDRPECS